MQFIARGICSVILAHGLVSIFVPPHRSRHVYMSMLLVTVALLSSFGSTLVSTSS